MKIYIGYDHGEHVAAEVARDTLIKATQGRHSGEYVFASKLVCQGLLTRVTDKRGGQPYDLISNAPKSTEFAVSRFLTPILCQDQWALFTDCDVIFNEDPECILKEIQPGKAVYVVKHNYLPSAQYKMVNQKQTVYARKNWSSVMLFDCYHPANWRLSLRDINERPGIQLHQFYWLNDDEIGDLDPRWNWLVGEQPHFSDGGIAHFTLGGPWLKGWQPALHDGLWKRAAAAAGLLP